MPKTFKDFWLRPEAEIDLENIWDYGAETWSPEIAEAYYDKLLQGLDDLVAGLKAVQEVSPVCEGCYRIKVGVHHIYYMEAGQIVDVIRILHERM
ncbi:MAG: type II toxin-antitoxin system RelE/ParE family toxin, partial [Methyloligellaceae bacterium]